MWLIDDFYGIISRRRLWERRLVILSLPRHRVAWYLLARWRSPTTFKETSHEPLPWKGKSKPSRSQWIASPNKIMIWKSSCIKGMRDITLRKRIKKAPAQTKDTKRGQKVAMPLVDQRKSSIYCRHGSTPHCRRDADDEGTDGPDDERRQRTSI